MKECLNSIKSLFKELNEQEIRYCIWKGSTRLHYAAQGRSDFDLLVDSRENERFKEILQKHDCKQMLSPPTKKLPDVEDYLGCDKKTGQCFHVHVYYQLILGENPLDSYRLPLGEKFLAATGTKNGFKVASPEMEILVRVLINVLEYRNRDAIKDSLSIRTPGISSKALQIFEDLLKQTNFEQISEVLKSEVHFLSSHQIIKFLKIVSSSPRDGFQVYRIRQALRKELVTYQLSGHSPIMSWFRNNGKLPTKKKLVSGGFVVALIGADGAGKSSMVENIGNWLSWKLDVQHCYMGLGQRLSFISRQTQSFARFFSRLTNASISVLRHQRWLPKKLKKIYNFTYDIHHVTVAMTRYYRYLAAKKKAMDGVIVLCDRYPLNGIHQAMMNSKRAPMDGPRIAWKYNGEKIGRLTNCLAKLEQKFYTKISPPDYVLLLKVSREFALKRKPDHAIEEIGPKIQAIEKMDRNGLQIIDIDSNQPFEKALTQAKNELWKVM